MSNQHTKFAIVHVETTADEEIDCLSALVYDATDGWLKAFYEARIQRHEIEAVRQAETISLTAAMTGLRQVCQDSILVAFEVAAVKRFVEKACQETGVPYPFSIANEVDLKPMLNRQLGQVGEGAAGLREAARQLGIRTLPSGQAPSWGAVAGWYILKRLVGV
ncbi:hypothetical protein KKF05_03775 [Patescibacteria group bacterium]|nr:hypothetical protein [Patescibacteria group bacterium]MBU1029426.1 hypothetical protein [Patescibacteria group bacterium]MBU1916450.1 hypothetical protein [Patescibacteria group bacterium]